LNIYETYYSSSLQTLKEAESLLINSKADSNSTCAHPKRKAFANQQLIFRIVLRRRNTHIDKIVAIRKFSFGASGHHVAPKNPKSDAFSLASLLSSSGKRLCMSMATSSN